MLSNLRVRGVSIEITCVIAVGFKVPQRILHALNDINHRLCSHTLPDSRAFEIIVTIETILHYFVPS
jgi:hypothetical protein